MTASLKSLILLASALPLLALAQPSKERIWVEFQPDRAEQAEQALLSSGATIHYHFAELDAYAVSVPSQAVDGLRRNPNIRFIEPDAKRFAFNQTVPYGIDAVQARDIWDADRDGTIDSGAATGAGGPLVCIIDSGLQQSHADFAGVDVVGGYPANWNQDDCGHGTHVAGTIVAANNDLGVVGVSPGATDLYIVKVFGGSSCGWTYSSDLVDAANHCASAGAKIISMSLGGGARSRSEDRAFKQFESAGILSIAAAGNDGNTVKSYPASYASVMSVAAVDSTNTVAGFSQQNTAVEIAAPGVGVLSTVPWSATNTVSANGNEYVGGHIENAALGSASGVLLDGGLCDTVGSWGSAVVACARGTVSFYDKVRNAQAGGAAGVVIYNNQSGGFAGTLGDGNSSSIPAISLSQEDGLALLAAVNASATVVSTVDPNGSGYEAWDGTSMATPHVSGVAALVWSGSPSSSNLDIRQALTQTALDLGAPGRDNATGYGLVQAKAALYYLTGGSSGPGNTPPTAAFSYSCTDLVCSFDASASSDSDGSIISHSWNFGDGSSASGTLASHTYAAGGSFNVAVSVSDDQGATDSASQLITVVDPNGGGGDTTAPVISNVSAAATKGTSFAITWTTDEPSTSEVVFDCCGSFSDAALVTNHRMVFRASKGASYTFVVRSADASGNASVSSSYTYP